MRLRAAVRDEGLGDDRETEEAGQRGGGRVGEGVGVVDGDLVGDAKGGVEPPPRGFQFGHDLEHGYAVVEARYRVGRVDDERVRVSGGVFFELGFPLAAG